MKSLLTGPGLTAAFITWTKQSVFHVKLSVERQFEQAACWRHRFGQTEFFNFWPSVRWRPHTYNTRIVFVLLLVRRMYVNRCALYASLFNYVWASRDIYKMFFTDIPIEYCNHVNWNSDYWLKFLTCKMGSERLTTHQLSAKRQYLRPTHCSQCWHIV